MSLYTLNGALLVEQMAGESADEPILTCEFYEGANNEWLERELLFTGHTRGVVNVSDYTGIICDDANPLQIWSKGICNGRFELELIRQLHHTDNSRDNGANIAAGISSILPTATAVYTGDEVGRVVS